MASNTESPSTVTTGPLSSSTCHVGDPGGLPSTTTPPHGPSHSSPLMPRPLCHLDYSPAAEHPVAEPSFFSPPCRLPPICVPFRSQGGPEVTVECKPKAGNRSSGNRDAEPQACRPAHASSLTIAAVGAGKAVYRIGSFRLQARVRWFHSNPALRLRIGWRGRHHTLSTTAERRFPNTFVDWLHFPAPRELPA